MKISVLQTNTKISTELMSFLDEFDKKVNFFDVITAIRTEIPALQHDRNKPSNCCR